MAARPNGHQPSFSQGRGLAYQRILISTRIFAEEIDHLTNLTTVSIVVHTCTDTENDALALWSASLLPFCWLWVTQRGLQPPIEVIQTLQRKRFDALPLTETALQSLLALPSDHKTPVNTTVSRSALAELAKELSHDLSQVGNEVETRLRSGNAEQRFLTASRDLRRFQRAISRLQVSYIEIAESESMLIPLFSLQRQTLYIPKWLVDSMPRTMFKPGDSFHRTRPCSLVWLLLDAIIVTATPECKML